MADNIATTEHTSNPLLAPVEPDHNRLKQARGKWNGKWRPLLQKGWYWALGSFIRRGHEGVRERNRGDGTAERCSQQLAALTLAVVSNDQLLATAKWHCVVRNTLNCWRWTLGDPRISVCCPWKPEAYINYVWNSVPMVQYIDAEVVASGIATRLRVVGVWFESLWELRIFSENSHRLWGPSSLFFFQLIP
jgi:hypothetical protein